AGPLKRSAPATVASGTDATTEELVQELTLEDQTIGLQLRAKGVAVMLDLGGLFVHRALRIVFHVLPLS
ncbi:hypothetical protein, partial [Streptomyces sp. ADI98-12]|uniref:hypothetical protein n=2 Tax=Streptomyces TaxID=1883 RepID=UPI0019D058B8